jgi:hypothetical protein
VLIELSGYEWRAEDQSKEAWYEQQHDVQRNRLFVQGCVDVTAEGASVARRAGHRSVKRSPEEVHPDDQGHDDGEHEGE